MTDTYKLKPAQVRTVRAKQWLGDNESEVRELCPVFERLDGEDRANSDDPEATAQLLAAPHMTWVLVYDGDWIVYRNGWYRMTDEEFVAEYEPVSA